MLSRTSLERRIQLTFYVVFTVAVFLSADLYVKTTSAQTVGTNVLSCNPSFIPVAKDNSFSLKRGAPAVFTCVIKNSGSSLLTVLLTGKEVKIGGTEPSGGATFSIEKEVGLGKSIMIPVEFPPLYAEGTHEFSFYIQNSKTGKIIGSEISLRGFLGKQKARIISASADKNKYVWGEKITITLVVFSKDTVSPTENRFVFDAVIKDKDWKDCAVIARKWSLWVAKDNKYEFDLPSRKTCNGVTLNVILKTPDGEPVDIKSFPVTVSAPTALSKYAGVITRIGLLLLALYVIGRYFYQKKQLAKAEK